MKERTYIAIDLKSFYASVECVERGLNPMTTNLVVADRSRTEKTICLAVSPSLKTYGIPGRPRLFEVVQKVKEVNLQRERNAPGRKLADASSDDTTVKSSPSVALDYIVAPPQMAKYMEWSAKIYAVYLKYVAPEDIHVYSIDEVMMDVTNYLPAVGLTARDFAMTIILDVLATTGITATAGIGPNLYLCKVAMDIMAKHIQPDKNGVRMRRDELTAKSRETMEALLREMETGTLENPLLAERMVTLAQQLKTVGGRKQYGYLKAPLKALVDEIVDELAKDSRVAQAYDLWYEQREEVLRSYKDDLPERLPLSQQKELRQIKNMVIQEAMSLNNHQPTEQAQEADPAEKLTSLPDTPPPEADPSEAGEVLPNADWTEDYKQARIFLHGTEDNPPDFDTAFKLFQKEAQLGNALAMCDLGRMWIDGLGRDANPEEGQRWYTKALSVFLELEEWEPHRYTEYRIGKLYARGLGTEQDHTMAAEWFTKAAEQGHKYAQYSLAGLYLRGQGVVKDVEKAHHLYTTSASQGFPYAAFELGKLYRDGSGCEQSAEKAEQWFQSAYSGFKSLEAQSHDDKLQYRLGWMHLHGVGVEQNQKLAREWFNRSAQLGNPNAQYQLAKLILADSSSDEVQINIAVEWLTKSAEAGQDCAQYALGKLYRDGIGVEKDMLQAVVWFTLAAEQDNSYAAYAMGKLYLEGEEVQKDMEKALRWLRRSAELENQFAQYCLGRLLLAGEDVPKDIDEAVRLLTASANQGNQYAQYQLGKLYLLGHEVERNEDTAVRWFTLSAAQGNEYAQWFLDHHHEFRGPSPAQCVVRLLHHMSQVFRNQTPLQSGMRIEVDKKLRQKIREKKIAMGHKANDHEEQAMEYSPR